jgi:hypothetical protein
MIRGKLTYLLKTFQWASLQELRLLQFRFENVKVLVARSVTRRPIFTEFLQPVFIIQALVYIFEEVLERLRGVAVEAVKLVLAFLLIYPATGFILGRLTISADRTAEVEPFVSCLELAQPT